MCLCGNGGVVVAVVAAVLFSVKQFHSISEKFALSLSLSVFAELERQVSV